MVRHLVSRGLFGCRSLRLGRPTTTPAQAVQYASLVRSPSASSAAIGSFVRLASSASRSSVDPTEISHFDALAASWWDPAGPSALLHQMNPIRHRFINRLSRTTSSPTESVGADQDGRSRRYLDIGCGAGIFAESAARLPDTAAVIGLDASPEVIAVARTHAAADPSVGCAATVGPADGDPAALLSRVAGGTADRLTYLNSTIELLPKPETGNGLFDVVSVFEVLEHVNEPDRFVNAAADHVRPGGWLVGSTISRSPLAWFTTKLMAEHVLGIVPVGTHEWAKYIRTDELASWLRRLPGRWEQSVMEPVMYVPALGWITIPAGLPGRSDMGNYLFAIRRIE